MKSEYYVATVVNAYRKALDRSAPIELLKEELDKISHRSYTSGFYLGYAEQNYETSRASGGCTFIAEVEGYDEERKALEVTMRNRFREGDTLEILSPTVVGTVRCDEIYDVEGKRVADCLRVEQRLFIKSPIRLNKCDILRKKEEKTHEQ
jgi:putative protease